MRGPGIGGVVGTQFTWPPGSAQRNRLDLTPDKEEIWQKWVGNIPVGRIGQPEEIGEVVAFLATDAANFIVGETIHVNGGIFMS